jgi:Flp pilus assembly protein TadD
VYRLKRTITLSLLVLFLVPSCGMAGQQQSAEQLYREASEAYDRGEITEAISFYERAAALQPDSVPIRADLGVALARVGRYEEAISHYREALKRDPNNSVVRLDLALALYKEGEFERAGNELESLRKEHPEGQQSLYLLADCYLRLGKNSDAVALLQPIYRANPDDRAVDYALGTALIRVGQIREGESVMDRILKDGNTAEADLLMGEAQFAAGDYKIAVETLRKALDLKPDLPGAWSLYGRALLRNEDRADAKAAFQNALKNDPNDFPANLYLGAVLRTEGAKDEAGEYLNKALRLRPASPEARFQIGALDAANGSLDKARKEFEQLEKDWPDFLEVHVELASVYSRLKLKEESQREQAIVLKLNEKARDKKP